MRVEMIESLGGAAGGEGEGDGGEEDAGEVLGGLLEKWEDCWEEEGLKHVGEGDLEVGQTGEDVGWEGRY